MSKLTTNFQLQEFVHPWLWSEFGERTYSMLHPMLYMVAQQLRDEFGPITINDWVWKLHSDEYRNPQAWDRCFTDSGLRRLSGGVGAKFSAHRWGYAGDLKFEDADPQQLQSYITSNPDEFPHIIRMENAAITKTWLHVEVGRRLDGAGIIVFNP